MSEPKPTFDPARPVDLAAANRDLRDKTPRQILEWAAATFGTRLALQSSMQKSAGMLMHLVSRVAPQTDVIFVDTGVHFAETLAIRDEFEKRLGIRMVTLHPDKSFEAQRADYGRDLYLFDGDVNPPGYQQCCQLRKEAPFTSWVRGRYDAVIGGLTRDEGGARKTIEVVNEDPRINAYKIYPLAFTTEAEIEAYTAEHGLPVHPLYARGYASIGCHTCTTPIQPGESRRAGRWRHIREANPELAGRDLYCGINLEDLKRKKQG